MESDDVLFRLRQDLAERNAQMSSLESTLDRLEERLRTRTRSPRARADTSDTHSEPDGSNVTDWEWIEQLQADLWRARRDARTQADLARQSQEEAERHEKTIRALMRKLEAQNSSRRRAEEEAERHEETIRSLQQQLEEQRASPERERQEARQRHDQLYAHMVEIDLNELEAHVSLLAAKCHGIATKYSSELGPILAGDPDIPLVGTSSKSDMLMRRAALETVIGQALLDHVLVDMYAPRDVGLQRAVSRVLAHLDATDPEREQLVRSQLLAASDRSNAHAVSQDVVEDAMTDVFEKLGARGFRSAIAEAAFGADLQEALRDGVNLWRPVQRKKGQRVRASMNARTASWKIDQDSYPEYGATNRLEMVEAVVASSPAQSIIPLFPQLSVGERGRRPGKQTIVFHGWALWSHQEAFVRACKEKEDKKRRVEPQSRRPKP